MADIKFTDNSGAVLSALDVAKARALEIIVGMAETYAKLLCPVGTPESTHKKGYMGGTLRNSIAHAMDKNSAYIGTNVEYAPYVELGTVKMAARPYLRPACEDHADEYRMIAQNELNKPV